MKHENEYYVSQKLFSDPILAGFLDHEYQKGINLARESGLLNLTPLGPPPYQAYVARFKCKGLVKMQNGNIIEANEFRVSILFPHDYLRKVNPLAIVTWLAPTNIFHPNIRPPYICMGHIIPGMGLTEIIFQIADMISYRKFTTSHGLNEEACRFVRNNIDRFPIDGRPLKRRSLNIQVDPVKEKE